jgi:hypothetical protein
MSLHTRACVRTGWEANPVHDPHPRSLADLGAASPASKYSSTLLFDECLGFAFKKNLALLAGQGRPVPGVLRRKRNGAAGVSSG